MSTAALTAELFGGALSVDLGVDWLDVSDMRPVPDNQEVWMERNGAHRSLVIELLELVDVPDDEAATVHFQEISSANGAKTATVFDTSCIFDGLSSSVRHLGPAHFLCGKQVLTDNTVLLVHIGLLRLRPRATDLLVSLSRPVDSKRPASCMFDYDSNDPFPNCPVRSISSMAYTYLTLTHLAGPFRHLRAP